MNILIIIGSFYPATAYGGPVFSTLHTCESLSELNDIKIRVSATNANVTTKLSIEANCWLSFKDKFFVKYYDDTIINKFSLPLFLNIWKDIKQSDVIHIQGVFSTYTPISLFYAWLFSKPILLSPRGSFCEWGLNKNGLVKKIWLTLLIKPFSRHIHWHATSVEEKNDIFLKFPKEKIFIIPNGIDIKSFSHINAFSNEDYVKKFTGKNLLPSKIVVSMGRLHKIKGFDILIKSFHIILNIYQDAILLIAGQDVGEKNNLDRLVKENNLADKVFFVGEISKQNKIDFLANADLFVLPSHTENFGNVYIESLAAGTPIVASKGTPWQEVEQANCGKWVENTIEDTSEAMIEMLQKDRVKMRINSKQFAKKYEWESIAIQFKTLFEEIVK